MKKVSKAVLKDYKLSNNVILGLPDEMKSDHILMQYIKKFDEVQFAGDFYHVMYATREHCVAPALINKPHLQDRLSDMRIFREVWSSPSVKGCKCGTYLMVERPAVKEIDFAF